MRKTAGFKQVAAVSFIKVPCTDVKGCEMVTLLVINLQFYASSIFTLYCPAALFKKMELACGPDDIPVVIFCNV